MSVMMRPIALPSSDDLIGHIAPHTVTCARAPLRISFCGGGSDLLPYAAEHGGIVLSATIARYAYATLRPLPDPIVTVRSFDYAKTSTYDLCDLNTYDGNFDLIKGCLRRLRVGLGGDVSGFELFLETDAPPGSGLGASSALVVAVLGTFNCLRHLHLDPYQIAGLAYEVERKDVGIAGGMQDQYAAAFGGFNLIEFRGDNDVLVNSLRVPTDIIRELEYNSLLVFTGATRDSTPIIRAQVRGYHMRNSGYLDALARMKALALEAKTALLRGRLLDFGAILDEEWRYKKSTSSQIATDRIDAVYSAALANGALGGKVSGAGGGGFMFLICPFDRKPAVVDAVRALGAEASPVRFEPAGMESWFASPAAESE